MTELVFLANSKYSHRTPCGRFSIARVRLNNVMTFEVWERPKTGRPQLLKACLDSFEKAVQIAQQRASQ